MEIEQFTIAACCGRTSTIFKTNRPIVKEDIDKLRVYGFKEAEHFTKSGILYMDDASLIITSPFGSNRLQVKCKIKDCTQKVNDFKDLLRQID